MKRTLAIATMLLTTASLANAQPPRGERDGEGRPGGPRPNPLMMIFDIDQDGKLSKDEVAKAADSLGKLDRNDDGIIEADELPRPPRPQFGGGRPGGGQGFDRGAFVNRLMENDKNSDGKLSKDEMPERFPQQAFDRFDEDKDGSITKKELEAAMERFSQFRGRRPGGEGRPGEGRPEGRRPRPEGEEGGRRERRPERPDA